MSYKSSVLTCNVDDDDCPLCRFLNGDKSTDVLLKVIEVLDGKLGEEETFSRLMTASRAKLHAYGGPSD